MLPFREEATKANSALFLVFPAMIAATLIVIMLQVRSFSTMALVMLTAPLGLVAAGIGCHVELRQFDEPSAPNGKDVRRGFFRIAKPLPEKFQRSFGLLSKNSLRPMRNLERA